MSNTKQGEKSPIEQAIISLGTNGKYQGSLPVRFRPLANRWLDVAMVYARTCKQADKLTKCTPASFQKALCLSATYGIPIDGRQAYLIPYGTEAVFMPSYIGLLGCARKNAIKDAFARPVYANDEFSIECVNGVFNSRYKPCLSGDCGELQGVFCTIIFNDGRTITDFMGISEIERVRSKSKAANDGPWVEWFDEMSKKAILKRSIKTYIDDPDLSELLSIDDDDFIIESYTEETRKHGVRKALPLAYPIEEETVSFSEMVEGQPEGEPVQVKVIKSDSAKSNNATIDYIAIFATVESLKALHDLRSDLLTDDPTLEIDSAFNNAFEKRKAELKR